MPPASAGGVFTLDSTRIANEAGDALTKIADMVDQTAEEIRAIATASEEQSATLEEINRTTHDIDGITAQVAESARLSSEAVQELTALSDKLENVVDELRKE